MKITLLHVITFVGGLLLIVFGTVTQLAAPAVAAPQDDVLCSSNMAYRNAPAHKGACSTIGINSHGHGGGAFADKDGDGIPNGEDDHPGEPDPAPAPGN